MVFLDLNDALDSVDLTAFFSALYRKGTLLKFLNLMLAPYMDVVNSRVHSERLVMFNNNVPSLHSCLSSSSGT